MGNETPMVVMVTGATGLLGRATPQSYTDPTLVVNSTIIQAQHVLDLRNGVQ